ncbi:MAG TPA: hypothetical protein VJ964_11485 [Balneolaceae bacterium]|nr:hypothetical protein [Balneolaceae bacterium]
MVNDSGSFTKLVFYILLFPSLFQEAVINFAWGAHDPAALMVGKRMFLLLPAFAFIIGCWITIPALLTAIFRHNRRNFIMTLFITWWDLGKAIVSFWGGIFRFLLYFVITLLGLVKTLVLGIWSVIQSIIIMPFRMMGKASRKVVGSDIPWIAVFLTIFWVLIESTIFTYVTTPLVLDTMSNITGEQLSVTVIRIPLFTFLFFIVLGSYAVLSTFVDSVKEKDISQILGIGVIEVIVLFVEVVFLYREFVDALVPWFSLYAQNFEISMWGILGVSAFMWFGIRSLSWFLFASYGTPTIMSIIQGKGIKTKKKSSKKKAEEEDIIWDVSNGFMESLKKDADWVQEKGQEVLEAFMLPPLQIIAAAINFLTLLVNGVHLFELPFESIEDIKPSNVLIETLSEKSKDLKTSTSSSASN